LNNKVRALAMKEFLDDNHGGEVVLGGKINMEELYLEPTIVLNPKMDSKMMEQEIFGPILPVVTYKEQDEVIHWI